MQGFSDSYYSLMLENGPSGNKMCSTSPVSTDLKRTGVLGVYRRGNRYVVAYRDPAGVQRRRSAATLAEARALKAELTADVNRGEYREQSRLTLGEYAEEWLRTYTGRTSRGIRQTTIDEYASDLRGHVLPVLGRRRLTDIEPFVSGNLAYATFEWAMDVTVVSDKFEGGRHPVSMSGRGTAVLIRQAGAWKLRHLHTAQAPAKRAGASGH